MNDKTDRQLEQLVDKTIRQSNLKTPSLGFTDSVMQQINTLKQSNSTTYKPLISKPIWIVAIVVSVIFIGYFGFGPDKNDASWLNFLDISFLTDNRLQHVLSGIKIPKIVAYAMILFGIMFSIQIPILKNYLDRRLNV